MELNHIINILDLMGVNSDTIAVAEPWVRCTCPLASATHAKGTDNTPSFGIKITPELSLYNCFTCGSGTLSSLIHRYNFAVGYNAELNAFYMDSQYNINVEDVTAYNDKYSDVVDEKPIIAVPNDYLSKYPLLQGAIGEGPMRVRDWLMSRGINLDIAYKYQTRYDRYGNVVFPTIDTDGATYALQFRSIRDKSFWYLQDEDADLKFRKDACWYGMQHIDNKSFMAVESQTDVLRLKSMGVPGSIGASCGPVTLNQIKRITTPIWYLGYDSDAAGVKNQRRTLNAVHSSAIAVYKLDWGVVQCKDGGELSNLDEFTYVFNQKQLLRGGVQGVKDITYKDKFAR